MTKLEELRAKRAEIDAEIARLESLPQYPEGWDRMPIPGEIIAVSDCLDLGWIPARFLEMYGGNLFGCSSNGEHHIKWKHARPIDWSTVPRETWPKIGIVARCEDHGVAGLAYFLGEGYRIPHYIAVKLVGRELAPGEKVVI